MTRPEEARIMVQKLSDFLRTTLKRADEQGVTVQNELEYLQLYLDIEKVRFGHRLDVRVNISPEVMDIKIPTLLLQPIVENAIKFGLYGTTQKVEITISAKMENNMVVITITNPFDKEMLPPAGTGFGLNAIKRRLWLLFARNDLLQTTTAETIFTTSLKTPVQV
jgi:LytS/YehU family sensor histidine kinase